MHFPWYKLLLSHFTEIFIEQVPSHVSGMLTVSLIRGRLRLSSPKAVYSEADHYYNFAMAFRHIRKELPRIGEILVLGTGLGSIPYMLERNFGVHARYDLVDADPVVTALYEKYTGAELASAWRCITSDACDFADRCEKKYDLICVDLFVDHLVPQKFDGSPFIAGLCGMLQPGGRVIFNRLAESEEDMRRNDALLKLLKERFGPVEILRIRSNEMYLVRAS